MPIANRYSMPEVLDACRFYLQKTGRRIVFEYALVDGLNADENSARELASRLRGMQCHVNLIPLNNIEESPLKPSSRAAVARFQSILEGGGVTATVRRTLGGDIDASCGQLRRNYTKQNQ